MKKLFYLTVVLILCSVGQSMAQGEQTFKPSVLQFNEGGKIYNYVLSNFSYSIYRPSSDSIPFEKQLLYVRLNFTINSPSDDILIKWIADPASVKNGKILFKDKNNGNVLKEFTFGEAYISNWSESFYDSGYSDSDTSLSLGIVCKKFSIGNVPLKNISPTPTY